MVFVSPLAAALLGVALAPVELSYHVRGLHVMVSTHEGAETLERLIREQLAPRGVNLLVVEVDYAYQFASHPELSNGTLTRHDAERIGAACREAGIRVVPLVNCLGHQSWAKTTFPLLTLHPEFDETPEIPLDNPDIYCRSWCPQHPDIYRLVFELLDEVVEAFGADAIHVGMDEVFLIASDQCPRCKGGDPAKLFAKAVNTLHDHFVGEKHLTMFLWGDRLLDMDIVGYGTWEASANGTAPAIDLIPKDIVVCDWHYEIEDDYPSVRYLEEKGFRVLPSPWQNLEAANAFLDCALTDKTERMLGFLATGWSAGDGGRKILAVLEQQPEAKCPEAEVLNACLERVPAEE